MPRESETLMQCGRCKGQGAVKKTSEEGSSYSMQGETECWLCRGTGMLSPLRLRAWDRAGQPMEKPADWIV